MHSEIDEAFLAGGFMLEIVHDAIQRNIDLDQCRGTFPVIPNYTEVRIRRSELEAALESSPHLIEPGARMRLPNEAQSVPLPSQKLKRSAGRKKGDGMFEDEKAIAKMDELLSTGRAKSARDAAIQVLDGVLGASRDAKVARLSRKYRER